MCAITADTTVTHGIGLTLQYVTNRIVRIRKPQVRTWPAGTRTGRSLDFAVAACRIGPYRVVRRGFGAGGGGGDTLSQLFGASGGMADALASGASVLRDVGVQVPLRPHNSSSTN